MNRNIESNTEGEGINKPARLSNDDAGAFTLTGIASIDDILAPVCTEGGLVVVAGYDQGGKTTLACQIAGHVINQGCSVRFFSSAEEECFIEPRILSSMVSWPMEKLFDLDINPSGAVWGALKKDYFTEMSIDGDLGEAFPEKLLKPHRRIVRQLRFKYLAKIKSDPLSVIENELAKPAPHCLIFDNWEGTNKEFVTTLVKQLALFAWRHKVPVVLFCEMDRHSDIDDCPTVDLDKIEDCCPSAQKSADFLIGISKRFTLNGEKEVTNVSDKEQFFTVRERKGRDWLVPVLSDFVFQRYLPREEVKPDGPTEGTASDET